VTLCAAVTVIFGVCKPARQAVIVTSCVYKCQ
jgi:hypothetical protein